MIKTVYGVVRGKTIELTESPGVAEGQAVAVTIRPVSSPVTWGAGLLRCAGALASDWTDLDDLVLEEIHADRKRDSRQEVAE
jgi:hypothetical protein